ncbi:MAG: hypothetical protein LBR45_05445 [Bacteroidales bacterium]|jgi:hypothetical protein|nr:hypothetical protein [Bacteroidales bacterium]
MKRVLVFAVIFFMAASLPSAVSVVSAQAIAKKKANKDTRNWRYEIEAAGVGNQGTYQVKVWSYSKKANVAVEQAKKNAVHGIIFSGFTANEKYRVSQRALASSSNVEQEHGDFFDDFFTDGGKYLKYVQLSNGGAIDAGDRIKIGKEYKVGVVVNVNVSDLRKDLEDAGIIKKLGSGF